MNAFARWLVRHPVVVLVANLVVTAALGVHALHIRVESSIATVLPRGNPATEFYRRVRAQFGGDDVAIVGVRCDDVFATATLEKIAAVTDRLAKIDGVERVISLTNAPDPAADVLHPPPLLSGIPPPLGEIAMLKQKLASIPLYGKNLVADDFKGAAINVFFKTLSDSDYADLGIDAKIAAVLDSVAGPERFHVTGAAHVTQAGLELMRRDLERFTPIALALVLVCFWISFWTVRAVVLPTLSILMALAWTLGAMVLCGKSITLGTFVLPPLLLVIGSSYAIHVLARYYEQVEADVPDSVVVVRAFDRVWAPLAISALTNVIGFGSLTVNHITAVWDLGVFAVVGLVCLTITSLTFIPAALQLLPRERRTVRAGRVSPLLADALVRIGHFAYRARRPILAAAAAATLLAGAGAGFLRVDSNFLDYFKRGSRVRHDNEVINREVVGSNPFYLVIEADTPGALREWAVLKQIKSLQAFLGTLPAITSTISVVDYLELLETGLNKGGTGGDIVLDEQGHPMPPPAPFWEDPKSLAPILEMVDANPGAFRSVITPDFRSANVVVRTSLTGSNDIERTLARIREYVGRQFPSRLRVEPTGSLVLLTGTASDIIAGQIRSLSLALVVIFAIMSLMYLSARVALLAMLPNVVPIVVFFGAMGWSGIYLNLGTSLIAAIALGIAVDSTIHYMARLGLELKKTTEQEAVIVKTLRTVGIPILYATLALLAGFLIFGFSSFVPIQQFGLLTSLTLATSLLTNLVLLPALLATTQFVTVWDLMFVKLGREPQKTIPLFADLRATQARIVALMSQLRSYRKGERIVRQGERGDEMFVLVNGRADVVLHADSAPRVLRELRRGDVFGEMGLVRRVERTADVVATEDVEVMAVNESTLRRVQRLYPRIAAKIFLNISRVLSDRLESQNVRGPV